MLTSLLLLPLGLVLLVYGADFLVKGAARLALSFGLSALVVGLTIVAFGTSSPELSVSVMSAYKGQSELAVGNIVGSNICNVLLILGLSAIVAPLVVAKQLVRLDVPVMILASILLFVFSLDGRVGRMDGVILFLGLLAYTGWLIRSSRKVNEKIESSEEVKPGGSLPANLFWILLGLAMLVLGSKFLVSSAVTIAKHYGISEAIIGLTIVAVGTSLPEIATSVMASIRGERDIAVGNVVGSNIFNILCVGGLSSLVSPQGLTVAPSIINFDMPFMLAIAIACLPIFFTGFTITRWNGLFFLAYYVAYTIYLILGAQNHDALPMFSKVMFEFVVPVTVVMLLALLVYEWKLIRSEKAAKQG